MNKKTLYSLTLCVLLIITVSYFRAPHQNFNDPKYNIEKDFRWNDHKDGPYEALRVLLPKGTDRTTVEKVLLADPCAKKIGSDKIADIKKKSNGVLIGTMVDKALYSDPDFKKAVIVVKYQCNKPKLFGTGNSGSNTIRAFYDLEGKLLNLTLYTRIIHKHDIKINSSPASQP